ncbi:hypothetical protein HYE60_02285 [Aggregatibacter actinomycetemcomitans]|uniref:hypothetical protein n=1 Tax=Aggregatibacter actinomycetemcomitans TaxID=714 RepID=UPI00197B5B59|nr:hypothetical protein [Aggregatibacter actinomycetemcomitans]MBN6074093.1 hypothetical protein [Aggregatibacter actinomycetemcomitans]
MIRNLSFIIFFMITGCFFNLIQHSELKKIDLGYISTDNVDREFYAILKSNIDLHKLYSESKLLVTNEIFKCKLTPAELGDAEDGRNGLYGILKSVKESSGEFIYPVKYLAEENYHLVTVQEYIKLISVKTDKLYCQYQAYFYESASFKSKIFEIPIKDFLKD